VAEVLDAPQAARGAARGGALRVAAFAAGTALSLVGVVLLTRHLGPAGYGRYQVVVALVAIAAAVSDLGMGTLAVREAARRPPAEREAFLRLLLGLRLALAAAGGAGAVVVAALAGLASVQVAGTALLALALLLVVAATTLQVPLTIALRLGTVAGVDLVRQVLTTLAIVGLVLAGAGLGWFFALAVPVAVAVLALTAARTPEAGRLVRPTGSRAAWRALVRQALPFGLATAAGTAYQYTAQLALAAVGTAQETGLFAASLRIYLLGAAVPAILASSVFPVLSRAAERDPRRFAATLRRLLAGSTFAGLLAAAVLAVAAGPVLDVVGGTAFADARPALRLQAAALGLTFAVAPLGFGLLALGRHRAVGLTNLAGLAVSAGAVFALAGSRGAEGAAAGTVIGEGVLLAGYAWALRRALLP
jgi:O-antigen/teichoic acid export membrane protein